MKAKNRDAGRLAAGFDLESLEAALRELQAVPFDSEELTIPELVEKTGKAREAIRQTVGRLIAAGKWECVWTARMNIAGVARRVPAYRPKGASK